MRHHHARRATFLLSTLTASFGLGGCEAVDSTVAAFGEGADAIRTALTGATDAVDEAEATVDGTRMDIQRDIDETERSIERARLDAERSAERTQRNLEESVEDVQNVGRPDQSGTR